MGRTHVIPFGPFTEGLVNTVDPTLLPPGAAQVALNVDLSANTLRGFYGPGEITTTFAASGVSVKGLLYAADSDWLGNPDWLWGCPDFDIASGKKLTYSTNWTSGVPEQAAIYETGFTTGENLGVDALVGSLTVAGGTPQASNVNRNYAITAVTDDGWESNPVFATAPGPNAAEEADLTIPVSADTRVTSRNIYATEPVDGNSTEVTGTLYYLNSASGRTSTSFTDTGGAVDTTRPLTWKAGGNIKDESYPDDHAPAGDWTVVSDSIHSVTEGSGTRGAGILVFAEGAEGNVVGWSELGRPWSIPARNRWPAPDRIRALMTDLTQTLAFTGNAVYALSGVDDRYMRMDKLNGDTGIKLHCGTTVARSRYGILFSAIKGLMLLQGQTAVPVASDKLAPDFWAALTDLAGDGPKQAGAFYGRHYFLAHGAGTLIFDFDDFPNVKVVTSDISLTALHNTTFDSPEYGQGLYVCKKDDWGVVTGGARVRAWMPDREDARGDRMAWTWKTGKATGREVGLDPHGLKRPTAVRVRKNGAAVLKVWYDSTLVLTRTLVSGVGEGKSWSQLPQGYANTVTLEWSGAGTAEVYSFELEVRAA